MAKLTKEEITLVSTYVLCNGILSYGPATLVLEARDAVLYSLKHKHTPIAYCIYMWHVYPIPKKNRITELQRIPRNMDMCILGSHGFRRV